MRLLHLSNDFYPAVTGGTELFVHQLIQAQQQLLLNASIHWAAHQAPQPSPPLALAAHQRLLPPVIPGSRR